MTIDSDRHFEELAALRVPAKRAAYSDRMAWTMALLAELAYERFDEESDDILMKIAVELAKLDGADDIKDRLKNFAVLLAGIGLRGADDGDNAILKGALRAGGFELAGGKPIHDPASDTQAFVAVRRSEDGTGFAVICFRGTQQVRDWLTNLKISTQLITDPKNDGGQIGNMHKGFHDAYKSVESAINERLKGTENLPLYVTGHSLGGALAVVATWYQSSQRLAACYTFGAPRVGDEKLLGRFKTPIYRIVNAADPVPFVPPSGATLTVVKSILRLAGSIFSVIGVFDWLLERTVRIQSFMHYGDMRYLPIADAGKKADYQGLRLHNHVSNLERLWRYGKILRINRFNPWRIQKFDPANDPGSTEEPTGGNKTVKSGTPDRIDRYHDIARYRDKLRAIARARN